MMTRAQLAALFTFAGPVGPRDVSGSTHQAVIDAATALADTVVAHTRETEQGPLLDCLAKAVAEVHAAVARANTPIDTSEVPGVAVGEELPEGEAPVGE